MNPIMSKKQICCELWLIITKVGNVIFASYLTKTISTKLLQVLSTYIACSLFLCYSAHCFYFIKTTVPLHKYFLLLSVSLLSQRRLNHCRSVVTLRNWIGGRGGIPLSIFGGICNMKAEFPNFKSVCDRHMAWFFCHCIMLSVHHDAAFYINTGTSTRAVKMGYIFFFFFEKMEGGIPPLHFILGGILRTAAGIPQSCTLMWTLL